MYKKFKRLKLQGSNDGVNWFDVTPFEYKPGDVIEEDSKDCGGYGGVTQNRWVEILGEYLCINNDKYKKLKKQYLDTATGNWVDVEPLETMQGELIEKNSEQCGYAEQWVDTDDWGCKAVSPEHAPIPPIVTDDVSFQKALNYNGSVLTYFYSDGTLASEALPPSIYQNVFNASYIIDFGASLYSLSHNIEHSHVYMGKAVYLPATETIIGSVFSESKGKPRLQSIYLPKCSYIDNYAFIYCSKLTDVYLNKSRVVQFGNASLGHPYADQFNFCGSSFKIHVPSSLYSIYISRYSGVTYHYSYPNSDNPLYDIPFVDRFVSDL